MGRIFQMILHRLLRQVINRGISTGIKHVASRGKTPAEMTPDERQQAQSAKKAGQNVRRAANVARKMMR